MRGKPIPPKELIGARLQKWPPKGEGFVYFRIHCGRQYPAGQRCPAELGHAQLIQRRKGSDPNDPASYWAPHVAPVLPGGGGIDHLALGGFAPEFALVAPEEAHRHDMESGDEGQWVLTDDRGYQWVAELKHEHETLQLFAILKPRKFGLTGAHAARRPMPPSMAMALEERIDPGGAYGFSAEYGLLGNTPVLPAAIRCPRCTTPNRVRHPTNDDLLPRMKA